MNLPFYANFQKMNGCELTQVCLQRPYFVLNLELFWFSFFPQYSKSYSIEQTYSYFPEIRVKKRHTFKIHLQDDLYLIPLKSRTVLSAYPCKLGMICLCPLSFRSRYGCSWLSYASCGGRCNILGVLMTLLHGTFHQSKKIRGAKCLYFTYFKKYWGCNSTPSSVAPD